MTGDGRVRRVSQGLAGITVGGLFLWLVLRQFSMDELYRVAVALQPSWVMMAVGVYALAMLMRSLRWHLMLRGLRSEIRFGAVARTLILGYAVNNLLPARLGELFRADYAKRQLGLTRSTVLGSILVERGLDGITVVMFLAVGLSLITAEEDLGLLWRLVAAGAVAFVLLLAVVWGAARGG